MATVFTPELQQLVQQELATGKYRSENEVLLEAMKLLSGRDAHLKKFREDLQVRLDRLAGGEGIDLDDDSLAMFLDYIEAEVNAELAARRE